jgi:hypothetical protein
MTAVSNNLAATESSIGRCTPGEVLSNPGSSPSRGTHLTGQVWHFAYTLSAPVSDFVHAAPAAARPDPSISTPASDARSIVLLLVLAGPRHSAGGVFFTPNQDSRTAMLFSIQISKLSQAVFDRDRCATLVFDNRPPEVCNLQGHLKVATCTPICSHGEDKLHTNRYAIAHRSNPHFTVGVQKPVCNHKSVTNRSNFRAITFFKKSSSKLERDHQCGGQGST